MAARPLRTLEIAPSTSALYVADAEPWQGEELEEGGHQIGRFGPEVPGFQASEVITSDVDLESDDDDEQGVPYHLRPRAPLRRGGPRPELTLTPEEQLVAGPILRELFRDGCTLDQVGTLIGVSRSRVQQIEAAAFAKLARDPEARELVECMLEVGRARK